MDSDIEAIFLEVRICVKKNIIIGCIYRPPSHINSLLTKLDEILILCKIIKKEIIIAGDFNLDLLKYQQNNHINSFINLMLSYDLIPTIYKPTRITTHSATIIDNIFTNINLDKINVYILYNDISDRLPLLVTINYMKDTQPDGTTKVDEFHEVYDYSESNKQKFFNILSTMDWYSIIKLGNDEANVNLLFSLFQSKFREIYFEMFS